MNLGVAMKTNAYFSNPDLSRDVGVDLNEQRLSFVRHMMLSRESDLRENILFRQGRGQFHVSSSGHEGLVGLSTSIMPGDYVYAHYRDRALMLSLGMSLYDIALGYFAKAESSSGGRQLVNHFSCKKLNIISAATPTALQCLPAAGTAWGLKKEGKDNVVFCFIGDASARQGEFFEALAFAIQESLPVVFVVEDNGYGISTPTGEMTPLSLGMLPQKYLHEIDARNAFQFELRVRSVVEDVRTGKKPAVIWAQLDRLSPHTGSDDHEKYRSADELIHMQDRDPLDQAQSDLFKLDSSYNQDFFDEMAKWAKECVRETYIRAENAADPDPDVADSNVLCAQNENLERSFFKRDVSGNDAQSWDMAGAWVSTLDAILHENKKVILFGEDIEDPKGGVFGLTKGLSTKHPGRVVNSPLAEATIAGLASGLSIAGFFPIFELQFVDFVGPAFNQIANQISTLRWRSNGDYGCPLVIYAPCGSFISNGGPWHSQSNEALFAHCPGLNVIVPSRPDDASNALYAALHSGNPTIILLPKRQFHVQYDMAEAHSGQRNGAHVRIRGEHVTIVAWGNCVSIAEDAARSYAASGVYCEVIDLFSIVPCDWETVFASVKKTGRLVVVQEDVKTCGFGQAIISEVCSRQDVWGNMYASPQLVSREDVHIGFHPNLERQVLPDINKVKSAIASTLGQ